MSAQHLSMAQMEQAAAWFRDAWKGKAERFPTPEECYTFATALEVVAAQVGRAPAKPEPPASLKHGRLFLRHAREEIEAAMPRDVDGARAAAAAVDAAEAQITAAMDALADLSWAIPHRNPAAFLAEWAKHTWESIGVKVPLNPMDGYPLCAFVTLALEGIGAEWESATVSDYIRGRRRPDWWGERR